jgi:hypothetical protein
MSRDQFTNFKFTDKNKCNGKCWIQHWCPINNCVCCELRYHHDDDTHQSNQNELSLTTPTIPTSTSTTTTTSHHHQNRKRCKCKCHKHTCEENGCQYGYKQIAKLCCNPALFCENETEEIITIASCKLYTCPICRNTSLVHPFWYFEFRNGMCHACFLKSTKTNYITRKK